LIKPWLKEKTFGKNKRLMSLNRGPPTAKVRKPLYKESIEYTIQHQINDFSIITYNNTNTGVGTA